MEDEAIVSLYWQRNEAAIRETEQKYSRYLYKIAHNILSDAEDCSIAVSDTYLKAWNSMPTHRPTVLSAYLGKLTRELSIDAYRTRHRKKRLDSAYALSLEELGDCVSGRETAEQYADGGLLAETIAVYLRSLPPETRQVFICRYFFADPLRDIARSCGMSEGKVKSLLYRTRQGLKSHLIQEGWEL